MLGGALNTGLGGGGIGAITTRFPSLSPYKIDGGGAFLNIGNDEKNSRSLASSARSN